MPKFCIFLAVIYSSLLTKLLAEQLTRRDFINGNQLRPSQLKRLHHRNALLNDLRISPKSFATRLKRSGSVTTIGAEKWPNGRVPYELSPQFDMVQRAIIARGISELGSRTCIKYVPKTPTDRDYVYIGKSDGCFAEFGKVGGIQYISLADECVDYPTVIHELMHAIGFIHEHQRSDRDQFVSIVWRNILSGAETDFSKMPAQGLGNYGFPYDYLSIMHYQSTEGSANGMNTVEALVSGYTPLLGHGTDFSQSDLGRINGAYNCLSLG